MSAARQHALVVARKLMRTFAAAPDARRHAQAVMSELKRAEGWSPAGQKAIAATDVWLLTSPALAGLPGRLRDLLSVLESA
jgi:hypothetical protein